MLKKSHNKKATHGNSPSFGTPSPVKRKHGGFERGSTPRTPMSEGYLRENRISTVSPSPRSVNRMPLISRPHNKDLFSSNMKHISNSLTHVKVMN